MSTATPSPHSHPHSAPPSLRGQLNGVLFVALLAGAVTTLSQVPTIAKLGLSPLIVGIVAGALYGNILRDGMPASWGAGINFSARNLLRIAVGFLGMRISLQEIALVGLPGLAVSVLVVASTLAIGIWTGKLMGLDRDTGLLTAAGSAICGAAAVLAVESTLRSKPHQSTMAVGSVVLFGTLSMFAYPFAYRAGWLPLDPMGLGLFFGGTIHEVAQTVGAASDISPEVTRIATIVKMTRVMLIVPVLLLLGAWLLRSAKHDAKKGHSHKIVVPWFAIGFLLLVIFNSLNVLPSDVTNTVNMLDTFALTMAMTALGIETRVAQIREAGPRVLTAGLIQYIWLIAGGYGITWAVQRWLG